MAAACTVSQLPAQLDLVSSSRRFLQPLPRPLAGDMDSGPGYKARGCPGGSPSHSVG